jgi:hypothetical protein
VVVIPNPPLLKFILVVLLVDKVIAAFAPVLKTFDVLVKSIVPPPVLPETLIPVLLPVR